MRYRILRKSEYDRPSNSVSVSTESDIVIDLNDACDSTSNISMEEILRDTIDEIQEKYADTDKSIIILVPGTADDANRRRHDLARYIDSNLQSSAMSMSSVGVNMAPMPMMAMASPQMREDNHDDTSKSVEKKSSLLSGLFKGRAKASKPSDKIESSEMHFTSIDACKPMLYSEECNEEVEEVFDFEEKHADKLEERMKHMTDTYSEYLLYLIQDKGMENAEVWKRAIIDKKIFSKIKNNPDYHPQKMTALCLCIGAKLNLDETRDLLARAGYALSPCDKTDIIFSYFIENEIYDMIELDIQLEEHGLPCIIA